MQEITKKLRRGIVADQVHYLLIWPSKSCSIHLWHDSVEGLGMDEKAIWFGHTSAEEEAMMTVVDGPEDECSNGLYRVDGGGGVKEFESGLN